MCGICGCGEPTDGHTHEHEHVAPDGTVIRHRHHHHGSHHHDHHDTAAATAPETARLIRVEQDILAKNDRIAAANRARFAQQGVFALNLVSSPGSGKTSVLVRTLRDVQGRLPLAVIEGDQQTALDAGRIAETGVRAEQINTGKGCHLDAAMIERAAGALPLPAGGVLFIENVGNLVCPAGFDLGEAHKVVVVSVTEGEDKPLKYPDMFAAASLMLVNKVDLLPHLDFDVDRLVANARRINPDIAVIRVSATSGAGMADWYAWLEAGRASLDAAAGDRAAE